MILIADSAHKPQKTNATYFYQLCSNHSHVVNQSGSPFFSKYNPKFRSLDMPTREHDDESHFDFENGCGSVRFVVCLTFLSSKSFLFVLFVFYMFLHTYKYIVTFFSHI